MHYVICYDLENDRLRDRVAKLLQKQGCSRVQRSVFVARGFERREYSHLRAALRRLLARHPGGPADSVLFIPLREGEEARIEALGLNNVLTALTPPPLKIIL